MQADVVNGSIIVCIGLRTISNTISNTILHKIAMALRLGLIPMPRPISTPRARGGETAVSCVYIHVVVQIV